MCGLSVSDSGCRAAEYRLIMDSEFYLRLLRSEDLGGREYSREEVAVDAQGGIVSEKGTTRTQGRKASCKGNMT